MPALADVKFAALRSFGHTGSMSDMMLQYLQSGGATSSSIPDAWIEWLALKGFTGQRNDSWFAYLRGEGATGALNDMELQFWGGQVGARSPEVQAVFDRMSALTQTEKDAIEALVDGMVAAGYYADITEIYAPCLNGTDFLTGFKFMTLIPSATPPAHTPGQHVSFEATGQHLLDSANFDTFATIEGFIGVYNVFIDANSSDNADLFGCINGTDEMYYRYRGNTSNDFNAIYNVTSSTPRSAANIRPEGDVVGIGLDGNDVFELQPGGVVVKSTRIQNIVPTGFPNQWHGRMTDGSPGTGNVVNSRYSFMIHSNALLSTIAQGSLRTLALQFLRDIGVTGIPVTSFALTTEGGDIITTEAGDTLII